MFANSNVVDLDRRSQSYLLSAKSLSSLTLSSAIGCRSQPATAIHSTEKR